MYEVVTDNEVHEWCRKEAPVVMDLVQRAFTALLPGQTFQLDLEDGHTINLDGVTLLPCTMEVKRIGGIKEFPAFQLTDWKVYPASRMEPEDVSEIPISEHRSAWDAASALVQYVLAQKARYWFEGEGQAHESTS